MHHKTMAERFRIQAAAAGVPPSRLLLDEMVDIQHTYVLALKLLLEENKNEDSDSRGSLD